MIPLSELEKAINKNIVFAHMFSVFHFSKIIRKDINGTFINDHEIYKIIDGAVYTYDRQQNLFLIARIDQEFFEYY